MSVRGASVVELNVDVFPAFWNAIAFFEIRIEAIDPGEKGPSFSTIKRARARDVKLYSAAHPARRKGEPAV